MNRLISQINISHLLTTALLSILLTSCAGKSAQPLICGAQETTSPSTAIVNVTLVHMNEEIIVERQTVLVDDGIIVKIGASDKIAIPEETVVIDGKDAFLMPGLADMHVHLERGWPIHPLHLYLANGVTTIRSLSAYEDVSDGSSYQLTLRDQIAKGDCIGPRIWTSGPYIEGVTIEKGRKDLAQEVYKKNSTRKSVNDFTKLFGTVFIFSPEEALEYVPEQKKKGYDFIKIYSFLSKDDFREVMKVAKEENLYVVGHIPFSITIDDVINEGMNEIAHIQEILYLAIKNISTNCDGKAYGMEFLECMTNLELDELVIEDSLRKIKEKPLAAAKIANAMNKPDNWGTIEVGNRADFILTNKNPLAEVVNIKDNRGVMANGKWYSREFLDRIISTEQEDND